MRTLACCAEGEADAPYGFHLTLDGYDTKLYAADGEEAVAWIEALATVFREHRYLTLAHIGCP